MSFKINVSHKGKTYNLEVESENLIGAKIGDKIKGELVSEELEGYELEITGTSDKAGFPGWKELEGPGLHRVLVTYGFGMKRRPRKEGKKRVQKIKGLRLRKTFRGNEISADTVQINTKVLKEGKKKFEDLIKKPEEKSGDNEKIEENAEEKSENSEEKNK